MALIKCPECGKEISSEAKACPYCGYPINKEEIQKPSIKSKKESFTVAYRGGPGAIVAAVVAVYILFFIFLGLTIAMMLLSAVEEFFIVIGLMMLIFDLIFLITAIVYTGYMVNNKKLKYKNCIEYDGEKDKLVLCTLYGEIIEIDVKDYIELKDNFFTDNMLLFTYRDVNGQAKKVKLGYCANRDDIRNNIAKINH